MIYSYEHQNAYLYSREFDTSNFQLHKWSIRIFKPILKDEEDSSCFAYNAQP